MYKRKIAGSVLTALTLVAIPATTSVPADAAVSKACRKNSHTALFTMRPEIPDNQTGNNGPNYRVRSWFTWCTQGDGAKIWKIGESAKFPNGTNPCKLGFQGVRSDFEWWKTGGAERHVVDNCDSDGSQRKVVKVNVFCEDGVVVNPGLENSCGYTVKTKAMWNSNKDHKGSKSGAFYYK